MKVTNIARSILLFTVAGSSTSFAGAFSFNPNPPPFPGSAPSGNMPPQAAANEPPLMDPDGSGRYDDTRPAPGMSGVARPPPLSRENTDERMSMTNAPPPSGSGGGRTASSINQPLVRSVRGTGNDPVVGGSDGTWWEAAGVAAYATRGQQGNFQTFTDQQRHLSRNEPQMQTSMPRRIRTDSGYAPGSPEYNASRDLPTNYGPAPGNDGKQMEDGSSDGVASYSGGRRSASVSAHGSWWDNTGRSRDASHGTQGNFQTFTDQQRKNSRLREDERGHSPEYRYY